MPYTASVHITTVRDRLPKSELMRRIVPLKLRVGSVLPGVKFVAVEAPAARVALVRELIELLDGSFRMQLRVRGGRFVHEYSIGRDVRCAETVQLDWECSCLPDL